jgi:thioredoxin 1
MSKDSGKVIELNKDNFEATVSSGGIVLVDCWAAWCKACRDFQPVFERAASRHQAHTFGKLNTLAEDEIVASLGIEQIPSLVLFRDGLMLFNQPGYFDDGGLDDIVAQAESLDMEQVRSAIEADQTAEKQAG